MVVQLHACSLTWMYANVHALYLRERRLAQTCACASVGENARLEAVPYL